MGGYISAYILPTRVIAQRSEHVGVAGQHPIQQRAAIVRDAQELVEVERCGVADHVAGEVFGQALVADQRVLCQFRRWPIQAGAARVGVRGLERVGLAGTACRIRDPGLELELRQQGLALGSSGSSGFSLVSRRSCRKRSMAERRRADRPGEAGVIRNPLVGQ